MPVDLFELICGQQIEIRTRHPLEIWREDFLASIGASYVVDPAAPPCATPCGYSVCSVASPGTIQWERERADGDPVATLCGFCDWTFNGTAAEGRDAYADHRREQHAGAVQTEARDLLDRMDRGQSVRAPQPTTNGGDVTNICKIEGCSRVYVSSHGRWAKLCAEHKDEAVAQARREGSLGTKGPAKPRLGVIAEREPEPSAELEPVPAAPPPIAAQAEVPPDGAVEALREIATDDQIEYHNSESLRHATIRDLLMEVKAGLEELD